MDYLDEQDGRIIKVSESGAISFDTSAFSSFNFSLSSYSLVLNDTYSGPVAAGLTVGLLAAYLIGGILFLMTSIQANMEVGTGSSGHGGYRRSLDDDSKTSIVNSWVLSPIEKKVVDDGGSQILEMIYN